MMRSIRFFEELNANSWPALDHFLYDGWLLRLTKGYSLHNNSVWPLYPGELTLAEKVAFCEREYQKRDLTCTFRLTDLTRHDEIKTFLVGRGYSVEHPVVVMVGRLPEGEGEAANIKSLPLVDWLDVIYDIHPVDDPHIKAWERSVLEKLSLPARYVLVTHEGQPAGYGRTGLQGGYLQLDDLWIRPELRGRGLGGRLIKGMMAMGAAEGAEFGWIPVNEDNEGAQRLYARHGFLPLYSYRYAVKMNVDPAEKKRLIQGAFDRGAATYGDIPYFPLLGEWLVETAAIPAGTRVLDVACGRGAVLIPAARAVGPAGEAIGIDLAPAMVTETNRTLQQLGLTHARTLQMDAENLAFAAEQFDFVLCGFALFFFPNLDPLLKELYQLLRPGGVIAVTTWGLEDSRWDYFFTELLPKYGAAVRLTSHNLSRSEVVEDRLRRAGFDHIRHETKRSAWVFSKKEAWWSARWSVSGRVGLERLEGDQLQRLKDDTFAWMETLRQSDGFHESFEARCTVAVRPS